jgi:hypothetical protein
MEMVVWTPWKLNVSIGSCKVKNWCAPGLTVLHALIRQIPPNAKALMKGHSLLMCGTAR